MKTLVYCTAFSQGQDTWKFRYRRWVETLRQSVLEFDQLLLVDDGSPVVPKWDDMTLLNECENPGFEINAGGSGLVLYHFDKNLGRRANYDFPGWYRSFCFGALYAQAQGFDKVIHLESDAYLTSYRMNNYVNALRGGWTVPFAPKYNFPEIAIQIIAGAAMHSLAEFAARPYSAMINKNHELSIPFHYVERNFVGDRYGEHLEDIPRNADYANQVQSHREDSYYWWLGGALNAEAEQPKNDLKIDFQEGGNSDDYIGNGWSYPEPGRRWMTGLESEIHFTNPMEASRNYTFLVWLSPNVSRDAVPSQELVIFWNKIEVGYYNLSVGTTLGIDIPGHVINFNGENLVEFMHSNARAPKLMADSNDARQLAFSVRAMALRSRRGS